LKRTSQKAAASPSAGSIRRQSCATTDRVLSSASPDADTPDPRGNGEDDRVPTYFIFFLSMLGASALLFLGAVAAAAVRRGPPPVLVAGRAAEALQFAQLALAWSCMGVCWLLYFNVYRIHVDMAALGDVPFKAFARGYTSRLPVVVLPYGAGALCAALGLWAAPGRFSRVALWGIATLWVLSVATTKWAAGAQDDFHDHGFSDAAFQQLQLAHLARSVCVSAAAVWALVQVARART
jgi:hypothetical protein